MKIVIIAGTLFNQGAEYVTAALARGLAARGHQVTVRLSRYSEDWQAQHPDWKPFVLPPEVEIVVSKHRRGREMVGEFRQLLRSNEYDVALSQTAIFSLPLALASLGARTKTKMIHVQHSGGTGVNDAGEFLKPSRSLRGVIERFLMNRLDGVFGVSQGTTDAAQRMYRLPPEKMFVVYNPVIDDVFKQKLAAKPIHPWLKTPTVPVVVAAGAFATNKRYQMLIRAFADVLKSHDARLVIFGRGPCQPEYERIVAELGLEDAVSLPGHSTNLPAELKNASCFVVSSGIESFSIVCVEALASGVPVVSTNCPYGPPEILQGGKYGVLVENMNQHALTEGILKVLNGQGIKPPPESWHPYMLEKIIDRYEAAMKTIMEGRQ